MLHLNLALYCQPPTHDICHFLHSRKQQTYYMHQPVASSTILTSPNTYPRFAVTPFWDNTHDIQSTIQTQHQHTTIHLNTFAAPIYPTQTWVKQIWNTHVNLGYTVSCFGKFLPTHTTTPSHTIFHTRTLAIPGYSTPH